MMKAKAGKGSLQTIRRDLINRFSADDNRLWPVAFLLFALCLLIHGPILPGPHVLNTYYDELLYWGVAKTFWTEPAFSIYHVPVQFSKFLYSMVLSPLFLIRDASLRGAMAGWLSTAMISFSAFPAYRLVKKLTSSKPIQLICLVLFMCSPIMNYGEKYAPESLYLPLCLYLMVGYFTLYQRIVEPENYPLRKLCVTAALMGLLAYVIYLAKEAVAAFFGAFLVWTLIVAIKGMRRKDENWKRYLAVAGVHTAAIAVCYIAVKLILSLKFSYAKQIGLDNANSMYRIEFLIHCLISNGLYICVALFGLPVLYWQFKRNRQSRLADENAPLANWVVFFYIAFAFTLFFISFSISLVEDFGKSKIRLHTRYYIPFLLPFLAMVFEEIRKSPDKLRKAGIAGVLVMGIACVLLLNPNRYVSAYDSYDTWHIQNAVTYFDDLSDAEKDDDAEGSALTNFFAKQTDGSKEITYHHGLLISLSLFAALMILIVFLVYKNKKAAIALFCCMILAIEGYNNVISVQKIGKFSSISEKDAAAYTKLDRDVCEIVGDENLLMISTEKLEAKKRRVESFFSIDWYSTLTSGLNKVIGSDGTVDLNKASIPVSLTQFAGIKKYPKGTTFSYVLCTKDIKFNENCVEQVLYSKETGYYLYRLLDPGFLDVDYIKDYYEEG
ncbi:MAG: hypothetical protein J5998_10740 [Clostridia bacterium]|nr:hypothetical protein [Clostridia bacterium]